MRKAKPSDAENKKVSIKDVARRAGVSITTVSRVINKSLSVSKSSRLRVQEAVKELKFMPSSVARALASGHSNSIGLVIPRYEGIFYSYYALEVIRGIGTMCDVLNYDLLLHITDSNSFINLSAVSGIIFSDIISNRHQLENVIRENIPTVVINNHVPELPVSCVSIDNKKGAHDAVAYLIELGHKRIAHVSGDMVTQAAQERMTGYMEALEKAGIPFEEKYVVKTDYSHGQARGAAEKLLSLGVPPSAIFVASDAMALEVINVAFEKGKIVPRDLSVIGFDDNPSGLYGKVALTTVRQPLVTMAQEAVKELKRLLEDNAVKRSKVKLAPELVIRDSCSSPKVS